MAQHRLPQVRERSIEELYRDDRERADALIFGRRPADQRDERGAMARRGFLRGAGLAAIGAAVGARIPFAGDMPGGLVPAALAQTPAAQPPAAAAPQGPRLLQMPGKARLVLLQERPLVAETPEAMLDDDTTPTDKFYIRNNGLIPEVSGDRNAWKIKIDGEVNRPLELTLGELKQRFRPVTYFMQLECGGNGRSAFVPEARGNQWGNGGMGCARWTGVRLRDVLQAAGLKPSAKYTAHFGADPHLSGATDRPALSRGVRLPKALEEHSLIVFEMNGEPLPLIHGGPARLIYPGWAGSASHKWVTRIWIRDKEHDGPGMTGASYRVAINPMIPGGTTPESNLRILESMPVRAIVTNPANGAELVATAAGNRPLRLRGAAWAGDLSVRSVEVSINYGRTWQRAQLGAPRNRYDWQRWTANVTLPRTGYYEIWCRATDANGASQPHVAGDWNPQGYGANAYHRVAVLVRS
ncbi:MAG: sulfite oxidase [Alphaproteobacteria bacterium]|nr:sulfite oxidase [Alphaproteobacteria bacterium]